MIITEIGKIKANIAPAHVAHYPMIETSGNTFYDVVHGDTMQQDVTVDGPTFVKEFAPTFGAGNYNSPPVENINTMINYKRGTILFYNSCFIHDAATNVKAGLTHFEPLGRFLFDIQLSAGDGLTTIKVKTKPTTGGHSGAIALTGDDDLRNKDSAFACMASIGADEFYFFQHNKPKLTSPKLVVPNTSDPDTFDMFELSQYIESIVGGDQIDIGPKNLDCYTIGWYVFERDVPTDEEIQEFLTWLYDESRAGNKETYPPWADRV